VVDSPPDHIENLFDELEDASEVGSVFARLTATEAGWLAKHIRYEISKDRERVVDEIESELKVRRFPPLHSVA
jgi:breast cancer 2 susceptibility protein